MAIKTFGDDATEIFFYKGKLRKNTGWQSIKSIVKRKLDMIHYAAELNDLKSPPGNRLELLKGDLAGFCSIRVNDQWRIIFCWTVSGPEKVRIVDYH